MAALAVLRKQAKEMGIAASVIRNAATAEELQSIIDDHSDEKPKKSPVKKKSVAKKSAVAKKATAKSNSKTRSGAKSKPAASSRKNSGKAKRTTTGTGTNGYVAKGGRNLLDGVDFTLTEGWNPREGSAPARIIAALKKAKGNREKAFDALSGSIWDFVGKKNARGEKRSKADAEAMLRYRISRTAWDFAMRTEQHQKAGNRVEYGTGGTGQGVFKRAGKAAAKATTKASSKKSGSKKASAKKATARKSAGRKKATSRR